MKDKNELSSEEWAYLAGYLDGDGCFAIRTSQTHYHPCISAVGVDTKFMSQIAALIVRVCGFHVNWFVEARGHKGSNEKDVYTVTVTKRDAIVQLCSGLIPYLLLKKERASILLTLCNYREHTTYEMRDRTYEDGLHERLQALNKRGRK